MTTSPDTRTDQVLHLLELLASGATVAEIAAADAPPAARDLALRISHTRDLHQHREAGLAALLDTARELATKHDPAQVLEAIVRRARHLLQTDLAYLTLYDAEADDTFMRATSGSVSAAFQSVRLALGAGLGGLVASTRKPYWTADYWSDDRFQHTGAIDGAVGEEGIVSICGTPLIVESDFVGVLFAANRTARPFTREDVALLTNLATLAAVTLVQTRALADAEKAVQALQEAHETVRQYAAGIEKAAAAHDRFANLVLGGGGVEGITHAVAELLGGWAVLLDENGAVRSSTGPAPDLVRSAEIQQLQDKAAAAGGRLVHEGDTYAVMINAAHERLGTLLLGEVGRLHDADARTVERAGMVTSLVLLFERNAADARQSERNRVLADLVAGRGSEGERVQLARGAGFDPVAPFCVLVMRGEDSAATRALIMSASAATGEGSLVGAHDDQIVALVPASDPDALAKTVAGRVGRRSPVTVAGVGPVSGVGGIPAAHEEGARTARALIALGRRGQGAAATELGFAGLIVGTDPDVGDYVHRVLAPVLDYDERRGTDLVGTLEAYFAAGSSPRHAASSLHVHVNTVSQRLERIGALLGPSWQQPEQALELQLALRLRRLLAEP
ncbi:helix-turn-helix domain-containing protein [Intrasporangium sp. DVR]|uniref:helix-turn-helix domain-containing protein n=1 Tax=Intrasporangium sp. DVR TaxID=3127867 RepID=UPI00333F88F4